MAVTRTFTPAELDAMSEDERQRLYESRVVTDLSLLPAPYRERIEQQAREAVDAHRRRTA